MFKWLLHILNGFFWEVYEIQSVEMKVTMCRTTRVHEGDTEPDNSAGAPANVTAVACSNLSAFQRACFFLWL